jgi:phospholipid/cholesterol/gamma-HCH transport system permease protein
MTTIDQPAQHVGPPAYRSRYQNIPFRSAFEILGEIGKFSALTIRDIPTAVRQYPVEIIRIAAQIVVSSSLVLWVFTGIIGAEASLLATYLLGGLGASDYAGLFSAIAVIQGVSAPTFCWIFAAKVGCGFAAELGTMRISDEIDAVQVMGLSPRAYLASTRLAATWLVLPFVWLISTGTMMLMGYVTAMAFKTTSKGGYLDVFWSFQRPSGLVFALIWAMITITAIILVSCYFGYHAEGGPVGVGKATALSMGFNMVLVSVFTGICFQIFFGLNPSLPIAN